MFLLSVGNSCLGELAIRVSDSEALAPYLEYLENFCFMMAVWGVACLSVCLITNCASTANPFASRY